MKQKAKCTTESQAGVRISKFYELFQLKMSFLDESLSDVHGHRRGILSGCRGG
jgi:hypothetical protein